MQLSNLVYIIILVLLIIILVILYFFSSDIRKNKNNLNIVESNMQSLQDKVGTLQDKIGFLEKKLQSSSVNPNNFSDMLNQLNSINQEMIPDNMMFNMNQENEEEESDNEDEDESDDVEDKSDDDSDDESDDDSNDDSDDDSDDENDSDNDNSDDDNESKNEEESKENLENISEIPIMNEDELIQEQLNDDSNNNLVIEEMNKNEALGIDDVTPIDEVTETKPKSSKKYPAISIQECNVGNIELGSDGETNYRVALNKAGRKFWKKIA